MSAFYLLKESINRVIALELFKKAITDDLRFENEIEEELLTIEEKYMSYYFMEATILNHPYYFINKKTKESVDGRIDISYSISDPDFILNELHKSDAKEIEEASFVLYDDKKYEKLNRCFIQGIKDMGLATVAIKHNIKPSRINHIDISPIDGFNTYSSSVYYEKVYVFRYRNIQKKGDFISILSGYNQSFYKLDYVLSSKYLEYLTKYKRPIEYIPKDCLEYYYKDSFNIYSLVNKRLEFDSYKGMLKKIKDNVGYENYSLYNEYLKSGIYYYKIHKFLKKLVIANNPIKEKIYLSYLTLKYQKESGLFLYECARLGLLLNNSINEQIRFLRLSYKLGSLEAKKKLYEHFNMPLYYDEIMVRKYS